MSEISHQALSGVSETLFIPLYNRAMESQRPDATLKDEKAVELVTQMRLDFSRVRQVRMTELLKAMRIIFTREMDRYARDFLSPHREAVVVHIGCGPWIVPFPERRAAHPARAGAGESTASLVTFRSILRL
jgi:O-methyltransferase involved in polyketide biosynthesis